MKKILFVAPDYYGFNDVVFDGLKKYSGCEVLQYVPTNPYTYKNLAERSYNALSKLLLKKNLKENWRQIRNLNVLNSLADIDLVIMNRPDVLSEEEMDIIFRKSKKTTLLLWDSLAKINLSAYTKRFDVVFSFESSDCEKYNFEKIENFYFIKRDAGGQKTDYDVAYLGTLDERSDNLAKILKKFSKDKITYNANLFSHSPKNIERFKYLGIHFLNEITPYRLSHKYYENSRCILDLAHSNQSGLSFRPFETIGLKKKLITNNKTIKNYDFYVNGNIFIIEDVDNFCIPASFFTDELISLPKDVEERYYIKNWVEKIVRHGT